VERFRWFSNGYLAPHPQDPLQVIDMRFSMVPNRVDPLWTIRLDPRAHAGQHVEYLVARDAGDDKTGQFRRMLFGH
jgi:inner membrane protein